MGGGYYIHMEVLQRTQGSGLEQSQNYNGEGKQQPQCEKSSGVAGSLGEGQTSGQEPWQLSEAEGQAGSADDGDRAGVVEAEAEKRLHCTAWGEIPQTEEALHMNMDMSMRQMQDDKRLDGMGPGDLFGERESEGLNWSLGLTVMATVGGRCG